MRKVVALRCEKGNNYGWNVHLFLFFLNKINRYEKMKENKKRRQKL
jgi:hypothetical protein